VLSTPILKSRGLVKRYGDTEVVRGLDLAVARGECFALLGPNGAGKTTTLRLLLGLTDPDAGDIELAGYAIPRHAREARMKVGIVPQMDNLDPDFTVRENLVTYGRYFGLKRAVIEARLPWLLDFAGLAGKADALIPELSGGMKRRLTLARALVHDPEILFLDEPTTGLDPQARHLIWQGLRRLLNDGKTIVLTTHFMDEAERLADRILILDHGTRVVEGAPRALIDTHIEPAVIEVFGEGLPAWEAAHAGRCTRTEHVGETVFCYTDTPAAIVATCAETPALRYVHRPSNLEDVFLKLTGRDLRD
jgi:lipooligosaccharide transport system ATP-binding protein